MQDLLYHVLLHKVCIIKGRMCNIKKENVQHYTCTLGVKQGTAKSLYWVTCSMWGLWAATPKSRGTQNCMQIMQMHWKRMF